MLAARRVQTVRRAGNLKPCRASFALPLGCNGLPQQSPPSQPSRLRGALDGRELAWTALAVTVLVTLVLWRYAAGEVDRFSHERFGYRAEQQLTVLEGRMHDYEQVLKGAAGLFAASDDVSRDEWRLYVARLELDVSLPGILGTGYSMMVPREEKPAHEARVRAEGFPEYEIKPAGDRPIYSTIIYLEPFTGRNLRAFGYDMYSEPIRREAMERARDTGRPALSGKVRLVQETNVDIQPGFLIYLPVYDNALPHETVEQRRAALRGFVYSPFRAFDLMGAVFDTDDPDFDVEVYDGSGVPVPENLLYAMRGPSHTPVFTQDLRTTIAGAQWTVRFRSSAGFERRARSTHPELILYGGLILSLLVFALLYVDASHRAGLERQIEERTRELVRARDEAESASRAKTAFLATVSHELRTPLNAVIGFSSVLLQDSLTEEQRKQLTIINRSGLQLLELIKEILDITSIEAGHMTMDVRPVPLVQLLREQCDTMQVQAREQGLALHCPEVRDPIFVLADERRLLQVVRNLMSNALKFTDRGSVTLRCSVDDEMARVEVADTGIGIPKDQLPLLFNPFQRITDGAGRQRPGTGLGLAISRRLVEAMGGSIGVESTPGHGSRFWFTLPLARDVVVSVRPGDRPA